MQRLAALVPRPRLQLIRFHGVLELHPKLRAAIVPGTVAKATEPTHAHGTSARMSCARPLKRVFDIEHCPNCAEPCLAPDAPSAALRFLVSRG
jgi:hypothetical protein